MMANHYSDQMTGSVGNLASFQCWAGTQGPEIRVVKPFLRHSLLGVNLYATYSATKVSTYDDNSVTQSDIMDMTEWKKLTSQYGGSSSDKLGRFLDGCSTKLDIGLQSYRRISLA